MTTTATATPAPAVAVDDSLPAFLREGPLRLCQGNAERFTFLAFEEDCAAIAACQRRKRPMGSEAVTLVMRGTTHLGGDHIATMPLIVEPAKAALLTSVFWAVYPRRFEHEGRWFRFVGCHSGNRAVIYGEEPAKPVRSTQQIRAMALAE
jgi:hypothetical protein